jgi:hypothetical protein
MHGSEIESGILRALDRHFAPDSRRRGSRGTCCWSVWPGCCRRSRPTSRSARVWQGICGPAWAPAGRSCGRLLTNGLPVVFAVNFASFLLYARLRAGGSTL